MSTRTERVFAAFQGPVLSVGTSGAAVVHMYRAYTVELLLPVAGSASLLSPPLRCASCGDVVVLGSPRQSWEEIADLECYRATLRSKCTSSKRHLRSPAVVLAVDLGGVLVCSEPFAVFSREPGRQTPSGRASRSLCPAQPAAACPGTPIGAGPPSFGTPSSFWAFMPRMVVSVEIMTLNLDAQPPPAARGLIPGVAQVLTQVPSFMLQKCCVTKAGLVIVVRAFGTAEDARWGSDLSLQYAQNIVRNCVDRDMSDTFQVLTRLFNC
eukprot:m51a1_g4460 hypothetical protein (267) ;mRNA; r:184633-185630